MPPIETTPARVLPTIWELPDELWERIESILERRYPRASTGRPRLADQGCAVGRRRVPRAGRVNGEGPFSARTIVVHYSPPSCRGFSAPCSLGPLLSGHAYSRVLKGAARPSAGPPWPGTPSLELWHFTA